MITRLFSVALIVLLLAACSAKPELRDFTPPGQAFVVKMPGEPTSQQQTADTPVGQVTAYVHVAEFDEVIYAVNYIPMPEAAMANMPKPGTQAALDHGRVNLLANARGATLRREGYNTAKTAGRQLATGSEYELEMPGGETMTVRQFVHAGVFYQVATTVPARPSYNQELYAQRFLDSLEFR